MSVALEFRQVDILFGKPGSRAARSAMRESLALLDRGTARAAIAEKTGVIVGVAGANLQVNHGEISVLMGLSGSGKSTLLRAANRLNAVTRGQVLVSDGAAVVDVASCDTGTLRHIRRQRVAMVFQQFGLLPWRTVGENVGLGLELRGVPLAERARIVADKLELVGLGDWRDRYARELSGGMQQRVGLARAFATDADILLMDEPFSALDPLIRSRLQDELLVLQERVKKTILFVSHDLDEALKLGDCISILDGGRIIQSGAAREIVLRPANDYVAEFVRHMNPLVALTGAMIMRGREDLPCEGAVLWLDDERRYELVMDSDRQPARLSVDGAPHPIAHIGDYDGSSPLPPGLVVAPASLSLRSLIQLRQVTGHPVVLVEDGRMTGVCGAHEIISALAGDRRLRGASPSPQPGRA